jgi:epoxyqueuosine reductase QueG
MNEGLVRPGRDEGLPELLALLEGDAEAFETLKRAVGTNFARKGRILAQALLVAGNSKNRKYLPAARALVAHEDQVIAEHALWCAERLQNEQEA